MKKRDLWQKEQSEDDAPTLPRQVETVGAISLGIVNCLAISGRIFSKFLVKAVSASSIAMIILLA